MNAFWFLFWNTRKYPPVSISKGTISVLISDIRDLCRCDIHLIVCFLFKYILNCRTVYVLSLDQGISRWDAIIIWNALGKRVGVENMTLGWLRAWKIVNLERDDGVRESLGKTFVKEAHISITHSYISHIVQGVYFPVTKMFANLANVNSH